MGGDLIITGGMPLNGTVPVSYTHLMKELMNWLNDSGVTTNRNQKFTYNSVQTLLTNKRYIGENRFKDIVMPPLRAPAWHSPVLPKKR